MGEERERLGKYGCFGVLPGMLKNHVLHSNIKLLKDSFEKVLRPRPGLAEIAVQPTPESAVSMRRTAEISTVSICRSWLFA